MPLETPRDRAGTFEPQIVRKRKRRLTGVDEMVLSLSAKGLTHGEIFAHLAEVYGASVSKQTISTITDAVMDGMHEWQNRPLDPASTICRSSLGWIRHWPRSTSPDRDGGCGHRVGAGAGPW